MTEKRNDFLDITRILAVLAVVMIHVSGEMVISSDSAPADFLWANLFDSAARIGVPLFVMVSGALMLDEDKKIPLKVLCRKNIGTMVLLLLLWSAVYCGWDQILVPLHRGEGVVWGDVFYWLINGHYHLWYMFTIIGLYLITPFLKTFVKKENQKLVLLFIAIAVVTQFSRPILRGLSENIESLTYLLEVLDKCNLGFFGGYTAYYLLGWYIVHVGIDRKRWAFYGAGIAAAILNCLYVQVTKDYGNAYSNMNLLVLLYGGAVFLGINHQKGTCRWHGKLLATLSKLSFGVYLVHPLLLEEIRKMMPSAMAPWLYILAVFAITVTASFAVCAAAAKIPGLRRSIRM